MVKREESAMAIPTDDIAVVPDGRFTPARQGFRIPARTQVQFDRQITRQRFQKARSASAIQLTGELHDEASAEVAQSILYTNFVLRGLDGDLTESQRTVFQELDRQLGVGVTNITAEAIQALVDMAGDSDLPDVAVSDWDTLCRWLATHG